MGTGNYLLIPTFSHKDQPRVVVSDIFLIFHPEPWGCMMQFELRILFNWGGIKPPTIEKFFPKLKKEAIFLKTQHVASQMYPFQWV